MCGWWKIGYIGIGMGTSRAMEVVFVEKGNVRRWGMDGY